MHVAFVHPTWGIGPITGSANLSMDGNLVTDFQDVQLLLGLATCTINFAQVGTTTVIAVYVNDLTFAGSSDTSLQVVNKNMTSLKISPWPPPAPGGQGDVHRHGERNPWHGNVDRHGELHRERRRRFVVHQCRPER